MPVEWQMPVERYAERPFWFCPMLRQDVLEAHSATQCMRKAEFCACLLTAETISGLPGLQIEARCQHITAHHTALRG